MKTLRRLFVALMFSLTLAIPAFAGEIETGVAPPPSQAQTTTTGEISTPFVEQGNTGSSEATVTGAAAEAALSLLQSVVSLI
jgi:hypothetical protein